MGILRYRHLWLTSFVIVRLEQHHPDLRARPQGRLPPLQEGRTTGMGGPAEQARWQVVIPIQGQALSPH